MKKKSIISAFLLSILYMVPGRAQNTPVGSPVGLMCDLVSATVDVRPVLIFNKTPAFSWELSAEKKGLVQIAYQLLVSDDLEELNRDVGKVWDSGKIMSSLSAGVLLKNTTLKPNTRYYWKVKIWDSQKAASPYSRAVSFLTGDTLSAYKNPSYPLQITEQQPVSLKAIGKIYQADFGKDAFAQLKLQLSSTFGGDTVFVRLGEILDKDGNIDRKPPGKIRYAQYVLVLQKGTHTYKLSIYKDNINTRPAAIKMPAYVGEVTPYRYCEIEGYKQQIQKELLTRLFVHYKFDDEGSSFHSSDSTLNAIWDLCKYSIKATSFTGMYVDGDRERIPYEADAYINQLSHYAVDKEFTIARNSHEYLITHPTWPTEWNLQSVLIAWNDYLYTGDIRSVAHYYKDLQAKTLLSLTDSTGLISTLNGLLNDDVKASIHLKDATLKDIVDWPRNTETDGFVFTKYNAVVNAFHYRALVLMEQIAKQLGKTSDAHMYRKSAANVKAAFQKMFFDPARNIFVDGIGTDHASLHANAFALALGLVNDQHKNSVMAFIRSKGMACSVYGSQFLLDGVYDACDGDYGLSLLTSKTDRSWFNMIKVGSTITLEAWDNKYKPNQDWNHAWGAAPANIISRKLMGIEPITPGWTRFSIKPQIGSLEHARITVPTVKGKIKVAYVQRKDSFTMDVEIPGNTSAQVSLPLKNESRYEVLLDGSPVKTSRENQTVLVDYLGSGKHTLHIVYKK
ncbi:alpha-L-rhamnosidase C-terminal domain-containing protein [Pedobacter heparinus]|uniref:alpha-L-rhamnosidase n=1 Tax=Pedobacter heparinus (strain ATCC 13125 / DSM 2366 / CIP 104194 / JCM 7457 / NBRC 12017 / NCIMB 9290 / NRRL B-14731 / HIM 762-3) TaxID=485917 RepID=C6XVU0_PEDHD|nr:family 78 glycoside hydrolase catalytic domain [Pedobacter heparinus]ACU06165.1 alpha-L-rhamnosidase [Pedobacter heparinus DSM 2366]